MKKLHSDIIFKKDKIFKPIEELGKGGQGETYLVKEEETDMLFAIKKYSPLTPNNSEENYSRFVDEMKILFKISHQNIVRIYNYYLYPELTTGFIQMEYIDGVSIDRYALEQSDELIEKIFLETLSAFEYLESINVLHRDIRPANIMIDKNNKVKLIDFGFGKILTGSENKENSVILNWPVTRVPEEVEQDKQYDHRTEIYYLGNLFEKLLKDKLKNFKYKNVVYKMCEVKLEKRYETFKEITKQISGELFDDIEFTENQKLIYFNIANILMSKIKKFKSEFNAVSNKEIVLERLQDTLSRSALEETLQDNALLINCFIDNQYTYSVERNIKVKDIKNFRNMFSALTPFKQKIVLDNINTRLSTIKVIYDIYTDDLPF